MAASVAVWELLSYDRIFAPLHTLKLHKKGLIVIIIMLWTRLPRPRSAVTLRTDRGCRGRVARAVTSHTYTDVKTAVAAAAKCIVTLKENTAAAAASL